jgi:hypothetical protein
LRRQLRGNLGLRGFALRLGWRRLGENFRRFGQNRHDRKKADQKNKTSKHGQTPSRWRRVEKIFYLKFRSIIDL